MLFTIIITGILSQLFIFLFSSESEASLVLPRNLNDAQRIETLEILGPSSAPKILGNPYPLGGYSGVELGYSVQILPTEKLSELGNRPEQQSFTSWNTLSVGKGLFENFDLFIYFTPLTQKEDVSDVGGLLKWGFYESEIFPANVSLIASGNYLNFQNLLSVSNQCLDMVVSFSWKNATLYTGVGYLRSSGTFLGGVGSLNSEGEMVNDNTRTVFRGESKAESVTSAHSLIGLNLRYDNFFVSGEINKYKTSVVAGKVGYRW